MTKLYIAFGSNLHKASMRVRAPSAKPLGKFMLTKARLVFRGVADVEYDPEGKVPCGLWSINQQDERNLDHYEGVKSGYYFKNEDIVLKYAGRPQNALIYLMRSEGIFPPSEHYVETIRKGYRDFGLDESYLDEAVERSFLDKNPDAQTIARRKRQKNDRKHSKLTVMPESVALKKIELQRAQSWNDVREALIETETEAS